jgi:hypothetical protein
VSLVSVLSTHRGRAGFEIYMSHFLCLVAGADPDYELAPFHEFECTGVRDEFVIEIDQTAEKRTEFESETYRAYIAPDGSVHHTYEDQFYRDPTPEETPMVGLGSGCGGGFFWTSKDWGDGRGYRAKVNYLPAGWEEKEVPLKDAFAFKEWLTEYQSISACTVATMDPDGEHKHSYVLLDDAGEVVKVVRWTNPGAKWDWHVTGGRYSDRLLLKDGSHANSARKGDVDWSAMERNAGTDASDRWLKARVILDNYPPFESWIAIRERHGLESIEAARAEYKAQPAVENYPEKWDGPDQFLPSHVEYVAAAVDAAYPGFAFVKDRQWAESGSMGWFGMVSDEKDAASWNKAKREFVRSLPDDMLLTCVDCHI